MAPVQSLVVVLAAEVNVVRVERLWPRALLSPTPFIHADTLTRADRRSYRSYATTQRYRNFEQITVEFPSSPPSHRQPPADAD